MTTKDKGIAIYCIIDEFNKYFDHEMAEKTLLTTDGKKHRNRGVATNGKGTME